MTVAAGGRPTGGGAAGTLAVRAGVEAAESDFGLGAEDGIFEVDGQVVCSFFATLGLGRSQSWMIAAIRNDTAALMDPQNN